MDINNVMQDLAQYLRMQEELTATVEALKDVLKKYMFENSLDVLNGTEHKAIYKTVNSTRIDTNALKEALPDVAAAYTKTTQTTRFIFN